MLKLLYHPITLILITVGAGVFYWSLIKSERQIKSSFETVSVLDQEVTTIASRVSQLETDAKQATTAAAQERIIRDELLMQKPGEFVVQLPDLNQLQQPGENSFKMGTPWEEWQLLLLSDR